MITYLISSNLCKKCSLQCCQFYNFPSFRSSRWRCSVRKDVLGNFAKFTGKHLWQSLFLSKVAGWGDCFWSFPCLLLKVSCLFHFNRKMRWKKGNPLMKFKYLLFCLSINLFERTGIPGIWMQEMDAGRWTLDAELWKLDSGWWMMDAGCCTLDAGLGMLESGWSTLDSGRWMLNCGH